MSATDLRFRAGIPLALVLLLASTSAVADPTKDATKEQCVDANGKAQELRRDGKLAAARDRLLTCTNPACPAMVRDDCAKRLDELESAQPTIIFEARDGSGRDVGAVTVTIDGTPFANKLDGAALRVDPGEHVFAFSASGQPPLTQTLIIREGQKERREPLLIGPPGSAGTVPETKPAGAIAMTTTESASTPTDSSRGSTPWKTVGWVLGGAGVVGLGMGTVFGIVALGDKSSAHCDANDVCDPGTTKAIKTSALVSDVGWIAGGVLLSTGMALVLFAPSGKHDAAAAVKVAPVVTANGAGAVMGASWW